MTKSAFKKEVVEDLEHQWDHKGKRYTSEAWFMASFYPLKTKLKQEAIEELIAEGKITREPSTRYHLEGDTPFPLLVLV